MSETIDPRYPVGRFRPVPDPSDALLEECRGILAALPSRLADAVRGLTDEQLDTPYREGGWTVRQLVHHVADSHMNGLIRVKLALTVDNPTIVAYDQDAWARLADTRLPVDISLRLLESVHARLDAIVGAMRKDDYARTFMHPENGQTRLDNWLQLYAWHSRHHVAHVTELRRRLGWGAA